MAQPMRKTPWQFQNVPCRLTTQPSKSIPGEMKGLKLVLRTETCVQTSVVAYSPGKGWRQPNFPSAVMCPERDTIRPSRGMMCGHLLQHGRPLTAHAECKKPHREGHSVYNSIKMQQHKFAPNPTKPSKGHIIYDSIYRMS